MFCPRKKPGLTTLTSVPSNPGFGAFAASWTEALALNDDTAAGIFSPGFDQDSVIAYEEYGESDGASVIDFALDVLLCAQSQRDSDKTRLPRLAKQAG